MKIDQRSPWFLLYTAVASAVILVVMYLVLGDGIDWVMVVILSIAAVVGVVIGNKLRARKN